MIAAALLAAYAALALVLIARDIRRCEGGWQLWLLYAVNRLYLGLAFHWRAHNANTLPSGRGAIVVANHSSPVDPLILWMNHHLGDPQRRVRRIRFLMLRRYYEKPGVNWIARHVQCIPVDRSGKDMAAMRQAIRALQNNEWIGIFPEGGLNRTPDQGLIAGDPGVIWLALKARVPIVPIFIHNAPLGKSMTEPFWNFQRVAVTYGQPLELSAYYEAARSPELLAELVHELMEQLARLGGTSYRRDWSISDFERLERGAAND